MAQRYDSYHQSSRFCCDGNMCSTSTLPLSPFPRAASARPPPLPTLLTHICCCRFNGSSLHQRDSRNALFEGYSGNNSRRASPATNGGGYGYNSNPYGAPGGYPGQNQNGSAVGAGYRTATPNSRGQYSDATLNELESQNDSQVAGILGKVRTLKDVCITIVEIPYSLPDC